MLGLPSPPTVPADPGWPGVARTSEFETEAAHKTRDDLGEMRNGLNPGLLTSQDFTTVDRHLWAAFELHNKKSTVSSFCGSIMQQARSTDDLAVKKIFIMALICMHPEIYSYYEQGCPSYKFKPWSADLKRNMEYFIKGLHRDGVSKCASLSDSKYPSVVAFVAEMTAYYVNL